MKDAEAFDVMDYLNTDDKKYNIENMIRVMHDKTTKSNNLTVAFSYKADSLIEAPWTLFTYEMDWGNAEETIKKETNKIQELLDSVRQAASLHKEGNETVPDDLKKYLSPINEEEKQIIIKKVGEDVFSWSEEHFETVEDDIECRDKEFAYRNELIPEDETTKDNRKKYEEQLASEERLKEIKTLFSFRNAIGELRLGEGPLAYELLRRVYRYYTMLSIEMPEKILKQMSDKTEKMIAEAVVYHDIATDLFGWQKEGEPDGDVYFVQDIYDGELANDLSTDAMIYFME